ncbi:MAG: hypothetical protein HY550_11670 [Elusimicrobia bacterium]|nr:hypothetical protein [Elusimicrobiota bacterium]
MSWVKRYFKPEQTAEARTILAGYGTEEWHREPDRVKRDAVIVSRGSLEKLRASIETAKTDYRDVLVGEEVDPWLISELKRWGSK